MHPRTALLLLIACAIVFAARKHDATTDGGPSLRPCAPITWVGDEPLLQWCIMGGVEHRCVQRRTPVGFSLACVDVSRSDPTRSLDDIPTGAP